MIAKIAPIGSAAADGRGAAAAAAGATAAMAAIMSGSRMARVSAPSVVME